MSVLLALSELQSLYIDTERKTMTRSPLINHIKMQTRN